MNNKHIFNYFLLFIINTIPFLVCCLLYKTGFVIGILFLLMQFILNIVNYKWTDKTAWYLAFNFFMLISSMAAIKASTQLYYENVSSDTETLVVGELEILIGVIYVLLLTIISIIVRCIANKNRICGKK